MSSTASSSPAQIILSASPPPIILYFKKYFATRKGMLVPIMRQSILYNMYTTLREACISSIRDYIIDRYGLRSVDILLKFFDVDRWCTDYAKKTI